MLRLRVFDLYEKTQFYFTGPIVRTLGKRLANIGLSLQGAIANDDRIVPSLRCQKYKKQYPELAQANFIAPNSTIIGNVYIGDQSSVWYGAVLRGDLGKIQIGQNTLVQDLVTINPNNQLNTCQVGDDVLIGPSAVLENCILKNKSFVGMGSTIGAGAIIDSYAVVAAGAVVQQNTHIQTNQVYAGNPATYLRDITQEEREALSEHHQEQIELARIHSEETSKTFRQILNDQEESQLKDMMDDDELALRQLRSLGFPMDLDDEDYVEQRVYMKERPYPSESELWKKNYDPYEQDLFNFPDSFKVYGENYNQYEEVKKFFENNPEGQVNELELERKERIKPVSDDPWSKKYNF